MEIASVHVLRTHSVCIIMQLMTANAETMRNAPRRFCCRSEKMEVIIMKRSAVRFWAFLLALSILLSLAACGGKNTTAATMHLRRTEGKVSVSDGSGKDVALLENLDLYSGYAVRTRLESYAWIDLDEVKLAKLDQDSRIAIEKNGKELEIEVKSGSLFFKVTEPLEDDETMNIRTSTMLVGIRGTCGWVEDNDGLSRVYLLEGRVECSAEGVRVRVNAGEMAELTEDGELVVKPFTARDIPDFVLGEIDDDLAQTILEASGLDIMNPLGPAELLRAEYMDIINNRPILDKYVSEGAVYTANGLTYASEGLSYAAIIDLDGNGTDELILVTQYAPRPLAKLEVYGDSQGRAALYGEVDLSEFGQVLGWPPSLFYLSERNGHIYAVVMYGVQSVEGFLVYTVENNELTLVERTGYAYNGYLDDQYTANSELTDGQNICPQIPDDAQMKNALSACLDTYAQPADYYYAKLVNADLYTLDGIGSFEKRSWNGTEIEYTNLEDNIIYAKLVDMDQDGAEELILITEDYQAVAYSWKGTSCERTLLCEEAFEYNGLYRDAVTGNIYLGSQEWRLIGTGEGVAFDGLTDHFEYSVDFEDLLDFSRPYEELTPAEREDYDRKFAEAERKREEFDRAVARFELIEAIHPYLSGNNYEWQNQLRHTVDEVRQKLMAR